MVSGNHATLTGVVGFLRSQLDYATTTPDFGLEQFADEIAVCWRALLRYDAEREGALTWRVECPADIDGSACGKGLRISGDDLDASGTNERHIRCSNCGTDWTARRLMLVAAESKDGHMWLDAESITKRTGVDRKTLDRWVREGRIDKSHGRYDARPILVWQKGASA